MEWFVSAISLDSVCFHICAYAISKLWQLAYECERAIVAFFSTAAGIIKAGGVWQEIWHWRWKQVLEPTCACS